MQLIDKDKLLAWLNSKEASPLWDGPEGLLKYGMVVDEINDGAFDTEDNLSNDLLPPHIMDMLKQKNRHILHYGGKKYRIESKIVSVTKL